MNAIGLSIIWTAMQITLIGTVTALVYFAVRSFGPRLAATTTFFGLCLMAVAVVLTFSPLPSWSVAIPLVFRFTDSPPIEKVNSHATGHGQSPITSQPNWWSVAREVWIAELAQGDDVNQLAQRTNNREQVATKTAAVWRWSGLVALFSFAAIAFGALRLIFGLSVAQRYGRYSTNLQNGKLLRTLDALKARLGCSAEITIHEHGTLTSAATIGWWRPIILLPRTWHDWSPADLQSVLAHELAHIHHRDFFGWVCAQLFVVVQFFHPLAHWLASRLRLEQELAADAVAADLAGGRETYLASLASLALRQDDARLSWSAQAFLPTRRSFLRRIEMLRDKRSSSDRGQKRMRPVVVGLLLVTGTAIVGWRQPEIVSLSTSAIAAEVVVDATGNARTETDVSLTYVPRDAVFVAAVRPSRLMGQPELAQIAALLKQQKDERPSEIDFEKLDVAQFVILPTNQNGHAEPDGIGFVLRFVGSEDFSKIAFVKEAGKFTDRTISETNSGMYATKIDDRTVLMANDLPILRRMLIAGEHGPENEKWVEEWHRNAGKDVIACINLARLKPILQILADGKEFDRSNALTGFLQLAGPIWQDSSHLVVNLSIDQTLLAAAQLTANNEQSAKSSKETLHALATLGRNMMSNVRDTASRRGNEEDVVLMRMADVGELILDGLKVKQDESMVVAQISVDRTVVARTTSTLAPLVVAARAAARRTQDMNSARQIMLALLNYESAHDHLPAARMVGPDGKTVHSWRVAILPYLEQQKLYDEYRLDEPWDSPHNKTLIDKIPDSYRSVSAPPLSTNSSFYVFTGPEAAFDGSKTLRLRDIQDGTSKTIFIVEAKRDVPWTKPEDIQFDPNQALPDLNGHNQAGNLVGMGDASVRFLPNDIDESLLKKFITHRGGEPVNFDSVNSK